MMSPDKIFQQALAALQGRNYPEAERLFLSVLQRQPNHVPALNLLTIVLMNMGKFADAETTISEAVGLDQSSDVSFYNYGLILQRLNKMEEAAAQFSKAIGLKPNVAETWNSRGLTLSALGRHLQAIDDFNQALRLRKDYGECLYNKANALFALDCREEAALAYSAALAIRPNFEEALLGRGNVFWSARRYDDAFNAYRSAFALKPEAERAQIMQGRHGAGSGATQATPHAHDERDCLMVSSRGILKSCDVFPAQPLSSTFNLYDADWSSLRPGASVYVPGSAIPNFQRFALDKVKAPIILVSGDCDETIAADIFSNERMRLSFIEHPNIAHWFSQNLATVHPKCTQIPIGLDLHTLANAQSHRWGEVMPPSAQEKAIQSITASARPWRERSPLAYCNFQFRLDSRFRDDRRTALARMDHAALYVAPEFLPRQQTWEDQSCYAFVISPHGNGLDCHRTWEALALGCIPVMRHSPLDSLYEGLPIVLIDDWAEVTPAFMQRMFEQPPPLTQPEKMTLEFWVAQIREKQQALS